ncbi:carboxypeptidase inhibitor SmCI-like [Mercenaria mercenaria]|uniref:carboxypeptidase inhibitor SmCI-like n=1 Tax=Mercenaria mercenaria TaxID=6596 RepID=UPI00234ED6E4|nr:carboxypeptidase inhibitor SmCI-like [Mercenaria mercenaria]
MVSVYYFITLMCCVNIVLCVSNNVKGKKITAARLSGDGKQTAGPECFLNKDKGDCNRSIKRYYYDQTTGFCREFNYTGCGGNLNNFFTLDKCYSRCVCSNKKAVGQGSKRITRYFYNAETEKCQLFKYSGSGGNANRFLSIAQCQSVCEGATLRLKCKKRPEIGTDCNNNSTVQFYYDKHCDCCRKFTYLGCRGNGNRFTTRRSCQQTCKLEDPSTPAPPTRPPKPTLCFFQNVYGDCDKLRTRYFYDNRLSRCVPFTYSGCGGNENNFLTLRACKKTCENN